MISSSLTPSIRDSSLSVASDSSINHSQRKPLSQSSFASKNTNSQDVNQQMAILKEKAHQSFMQVMYGITYLVKYSSFMRRN